MYNTIIEVYTSILFIEFQIILISDIRNKIKTNMTRNHTKVNMLNIIYLLSYFLKIHLLINNYLEKLVFI